MSTSLSRVVIAIVAVLAALTMPTTAAAAAPANDDFDDRITLGGPAGTVNGSTIDSTGEPGESCEFGCGSSVWYRWTAPAGSTEPVTFSLCGSSFDTALEVFTGTSLPLTRLVGDDDGCGTLQSRLSFSPVPGTTYAIRVAGSFSAAGSYTLAYPAGATDTVPPVITVPSAVYGTATSAAGASVTWIGVSATDDVDPVVTPICTPANGSTFAFGTTWVTCYAWDAAGNAATPKVFPVYVPYSWSGVLAPVNADGESIFKRGSTVPFKFRLTGYSAGITDAQASISLVKLSSSVLGEDVETSVSITSTSGTSFRYADGTYSYNLGTKGMSKGTWRATIDLGDGISRTVRFSLR